MNVVEVFIAGWTSPPLEQFGVGSVANGVEECGKANTQRARRDPPCNTSIGGAFGDGQQSIVKVERLSWTNEQDYNIGSNRLVFCDSFTGKMFLKELIVNRVLVMCFSSLISCECAHAAEEPRQALAILDVETGQYRAVAPHTKLGIQGSPCFSPDHKQIAFDAWAQGERFNDVRLLVKSVNDPDEPAVDFGSGAMPSYSKTGEEIAFSRPGSGVWVMDSEGRGEVQVSRNAWHIVFSPLDEDVVAYGGIRGPSGPNIMIHNLLTDETRRVLSEEISQKYRRIYFNFQWSHDGQRILFKADRTSGESVLAVVGTGEGNPEWIELGELAGASRSCIHPRTGHVYFAVNAPAQESLRIFSIGPDASSVSDAPHTYLPGQPEGGHNYPGVWSANGKLFAFVTTGMADRKANQPTTDSPE